MLSTNDASWASVANFGAGGVLNKLSNLLDFMEGEGAVGGKEGSRILLHPIKEMLLLTQLDEKPDPEV